MLITFCFMFIKSSETEQKFIIKQKANQCALRANTIQVKNFLFFFTVYYLNIFNLDTCIF